MDLKRVSINQNSLTASYITHKNSKNEIGEWNRIREF